MISAIEGHYFFDALCEHILLFAPKVPLTPFHTLIARNMTRYLWNPTECASVTGKLATLECKNGLVCPLLSAIIMIMSVSVTYTSSIFWQL